MVQNRLPLEQFIFALYSSDVVSARYVPRFCFCVSMVVFFVVFFSRKGRGSRCVETEMHEKLALWCVVFRRYSSRPAAGGLMLEQAPFPHESISDSDVKPPFPSA